MTYIQVTYGVPTISRLLKIIGLFCKRALYRDCILQNRSLLQNIVSFTGLFCKRDL